MKIKILNKNNNQWYDIDEGAVITKNYNETLDSMTIRISQQSSKLKIEPYDKVIVVDKETNPRFSPQYMCVDTISERMICINPSIYEYEISLFSETKELESNPLPNLSITNENGVKSLYHYIIQYNNEFGTKVRKKLIDSDEKDIILSDVVSLPRTETFTVSDLIDAEVDIDRTQVSIIQGSGSIVSETVFDSSTGTFTITLTGTLTSGVVELEINVIYGFTKIIFRNKYLLGRNVYDDTETVESRFLQTVCPEMQWNAPTFREVINDLMMIDDCIPVVRNNRIDFLDLTQIRKDISENSHINYIESSQSSEDYVSEIQMNLHNVMKSKTEGINDVVTVSEWVPFICEDGSYLIDSNNIVLKTKNPILKIKHLWLNFRGLPHVKNKQLTWTHYINTFTDLCHIKGKNDSAYSNLVSEEKEYITKKVAYKTGQLNEDKFSEFALYQNFTLHYSRGGKTIYGFGKQTKNVEILFIYSYTNIISFLLEKIAYLCYQDVLDYAQEVNPAEDGYDYITHPNGGMNSFHKIWFKIEYETNADSLFRASKSEVKSNKRIIIDNQTNAFVDSVSQGFLEYQKANRLGNETKSINARYEDDYSNLIEIGDYFEEDDDTYIVYQTQYQVYDNHIEVNAYATKNYIIRDYFTGVQSKIRSWKIADESESFTKHTLEKIYCEFSKELKNEIHFTDYNLVGYMLTPFTSNIVKPINHCFAKITATSQIPSGTNYYDLDLVSRVIGKSIVFTVGFDDNYYAYKSWDTDLVTINFLREIEIDSGVTGGIPISFNPYTDDKGELSKINIIYCNSILDEYDGSYSWEDLSASGDYPIAQMEKVIQKPITDYSDFSQYKKFESKYEYRKDNREIVRTSIQFEFMSDNKDIFVSSAFINSQEMIRNIENNLPIKIFKGDSRNYNRVNPSIDDAQLTSLSLSFNNIRNLSSEISINDSDYQEKTFYICDNLDNILLVINNSNHCYLNILKDRDTNIYDDNGNIIGHI